LNCDDSQNPKPCLAGESLLFVSFLEHFQFALGFAHFAFQVVFVSREVGDRSAQGNDATIVESHIICLSIEHQSLDAAK